MQRTNTPLAEAADVVKQFASVTALGGVSVTVQRGEIFALLGPNGAGKTTLIRMLLGLIHPDAGSIRYHLRGEPERVPQPHELGYLPEERGLYQDVEVRRTLRYFGALRGMTPAATDAAALQWLERMNLADRATEPVKALSKGNQQKVQFISAILHQPAFAILDEPFSGLDPLNQELFLDLIRELRDAGTTVLLSAHQMQLVERIADRIVVLNHGRTVLEGTIPEIRRRWTTGRRIVLHVNGGVPPHFTADMDGSIEARVGADGTLELFVPEERPLSPVVAAAAAALDIRDIETHSVTLHDVYVRSVAGREEGGAAQ